jgi:Na+/proline symporter
MKSHSGRAILGGFLGTLAITFLMYFVSPLMTGEPMDVAEMLGSLIGNNWALGMLWHFFNGTVIFPLIFALLLWNWLPGGPTAKGMTWGLVLWFLAQAVVMPMMGAGFFSANAGGLMAVIGSFIGHLIYGAILGAVTGRPTEEARAVRAA